MKPYLDILRLIWPLALGMMNNAVLQFTDRAFLAHESMVSLEAVLPASMLALVVLGFFQSVVAYSGTFVAQYHGAGKPAMARRSYHAGTLMALAFGALMVLALPLGDWVFEAFSNGAEVIARQKTYFNICTAGGVLLFGQMSAQSYFTALGRTRLVLGVNVAGNAVNVALDPILIFGWWGVPRLGIAGAAWATVAATAVQWAILAFAARKGVSAARPASASGGSIADELSPLVLVGRILRYGVPSGAYSVLNILSFTIFVFFTGGVGHVAAAVSNACFTVNYLLIAPMEGFALGAATLVAQAQGRRDSVAAMRAGIRTVSLGVALVAVLSVLVVVFNRPILGIFASQVPPADAEQFRSLGLTLFVLMALWQVFDAADVIVSGALKGVGDTRFVMWWMAVCAFGLWLPAVWVVSRVHNTMPALWGTMILYVMVICGGSLLRWCRGGWRRIRMV